MKLFETDRLNKAEDLVIAIYWIGYHIRSETIQKDLFLQNYFRSKNLYPDSNSTDSKFFEHFELTFDGQPICLNEYATWIAEESNTHVILIDDQYDLMEEPLKFYKAICPTYGEQNVVETKMWKINSPPILEQENDLGRILEELEEEEQLALEN